MPFAWCGSCGKSFPLRKGYYLRDKIGRPSCPCCGRLLRVRRRSPDHRYKIARHKIILVKVED